jgi:hypothetical protein
VLPSARVGEELYALVVKVGFNLSDPLAQVR